MANIKITEYAELAAPISTDVIEVVSDPGGTPISKKVQIRNLFKGGGQIAFPATAVPSADPNTMDGYEEGDWTPALGASGSGSGTVSDVYGRYTKLGRLVSIWFTITLINVGTLSGSIALVASSLPFTRLSETLIAYTYGGKVLRSPCGTQFVSFLGNNLNPANAVLYYFDDTAGNHGAITTGLYAGEMIYWI